MDEAFAFQGIEEGGDGLAGGADDGGELFGTEPVGEAGGGALRTGVFGLAQKQVEQPAAHIVEDETVDDGKRMQKVGAGEVVSVHIQGRKISGVTNGGGKFLTYAPEDPNLVSTLMQKKIEVVAEPDEESPWYMTLLASWFPMVLLIGVWIFFMRQMQNGGGRAMNFGRSRARMISQEQTRVTFDDVAGVDEAKEELTEVVQFLSDPKKFTRLGGRIPKGVLLVGSPGTGKTLLARAVAGEAGVPFFSISGSDFVEMFVGVGAARVRDLFMTKELLLTIFFPDTPLHDGAVIVRGETVAAAGCIMEVPPDMVSRYGIIEGEEFAPGLYRVRNLVEKPKANEAPSRLAIVGRYVLFPDIFYHLEKVVPGHDLDRFVAVQQGRGVAFATPAPVVTDTYAYIQTVPSVHTGNSLGFIAWKGEPGRYAHAGTRPLPCDLSIPPAPWRAHLRGLDHVATRVRARARDAAILEFLSLTNYRFDFAVYVESLNSITNVARLADGQYAQVFTSGIAPADDDAPDTAGPTERFICNYGLRPHHMAFRVEHIETVVAGLQAAGMGFLSALVGSREEGLKQIFSTMSPKTYLVNEYIERYDGFDGFFTKANVTHLTKATEKQ